MNILRNLAVSMTVIFTLCLAAASAENLESDGFVPVQTPSASITATVTSPESGTTSDATRSTMENPIGQEPSTQIDQTFQEVKKALGSFFQALCELFRSLSRIFSSLFDSPGSSSSSDSVSSGPSSPELPSGTTSPDTTTSPAVATESRPALPPAQSPIASATPRPEPAGTPSPVPYHCQWDNAIDDFGTCQNTSIAMTLNALGWKGRPDDITREFGRKLGQTPEGVAQIINAIASRSGLKYRAKSHRSPLSSFKSALGNGFPVITHGWFTKSGHVVCVKGYENGNYIVNDPAGKWNGCMYGSINGWVSGEDVRYDAASFERAIDDGTVWYTEIVPA